jgi:hypothetical protein
VTELRKRSELLRQIIELATLASEPRVLDMAEERLEGVMAEIEAGEQLTKLLGSN